MRGGAVHLEVNDLKGAKFYLIMNKNVCFELFELFFKGFNVSIIKGYK